MTTRDGIPELPTIDLDGPDDDARPRTGPDEPVPDDRRRTVARFVAAAVALAVAFTLGVVVNDARRTSSAEQDVAFVAGAPYRGGLGNPQGQAEVRVNLPVINTGTAPATIVGLEVRGFRIPDPVDVPAEPGRWSTIRTAVIPDCDFRAGRELHLTVMTPGGRQDVSVALQASDTGLTTIWSARCDPRTVFQALTTTGITVVDVEGDTAVTTIPLRTDLIEDIRIEDAGSQTTGLAATVAGLPVTLEPPRTVTVALTWTVTNCQAARSMTELRLGATIEIPERNVPSTTTTVTLPTETLVELVRFVESRCG